MQYTKANSTHPNMGLNNKICKDPKYFCVLHQVFLSDDDVKLKKCLCKPTFDMISTKKCGSLKETNEWKKENKLSNELVKNIKRNNINKSQLPYGA